VGDIVKGDVVYAHTQLLSSALWSMLQVRRETGLRNSAHSLVKLMNPVHGPCLLVTSYTHPDYAASMLTSLQAMAANAVLLRGTEGEPVADLRKIPVMQCLLQGRPVDALENPAQVQHVTTELPLHLDVQQTADYIEKILNGHIPVPPPVQAQADLISRLSNACSRKPIEGNAS
jgi:anthranilate phosphoribosyltransferase